MTPKLLLMTPLGHYAPAEWDGENTSGITPMGDRVLILPDGAASETAGGISVTDEMQARMSEAAETGILVALGEDAWLWNSDRSRKYEGAKPQPGQRVIFERYAGSYHHAGDGRKYRLMDDKCVGGLFDLSMAKTVPARKAPSLLGIKRPPLVAAR